MDGNAIDSSYSRFIRPPSPFTVNPSTSPPLKPHKAVVRGKLRLWSLTPPATTIRLYIWYFVGDFRANDLHYTTAHLYL